MKVTIKDVYRCGYCGRKVKDINPNRRTQYCDERHRRLHEEWKKGGYKKHL